MESTSLFSSSTNTSFQRSVNKDTLLEIFRDLYAKENYAQYYDKVNTILETLKKHPQIINSGGNYQIKAHSKKWSINTMHYSSLCNYRTVNTAPHLTSSASCLGGSLRTNNAYLICPVSIADVDPQQDFIDAAAYQEYLWFKFKTKNNLYKLAGLPFDDVEYGHVIKNILKAYHEISGKTPTISFGKNEYDILMRINFGNSNTYEGYVFGCLIRNTWCLESHYSTFNVNLSVEEMFAKNILHTMFHFAVSSDSSFNRNNLFVLRGADGNNYTCPPVSASIVSNFDNLIPLLPKTFNFNNLKNAVNAYGYYTT